MVLILYSKSWVFKVNWRTFCNWVISQPKSQKRTVVWKPVVHAWLKYFTVDPLRYAWKNTQEFTTKCAATRLSWGQLHSEETLRLSGIIYNLVKGGAHGVIQCFRCELERCASWTAWSRVWLVAHCRHTLAQLPWGGSENQTQLMTSPSIA